MIRSLMTGCCRTNVHSCSLSGPGLPRIDSVTASLPMSWSSAASFKLPGSSGDHDRQRGGNQRKPDDVRLPEVVPDLEPETDERERRRHDQEASAFELGHAASVR